MGCTVRVMADGVADLVGAAEAASVEDHQADHGAVAAEDSPAAVHQVLGNKNLRIKYDF